MEFDGAHPWFLMGTVPVISCWGQTLDGIAMRLMGTVPVIYFHDFWSSPHHLFPGTVPVILGPVPAISRDFGDSPHHFPYTNDTSQNFTNQPLVSHVPRNLQ